MREFFGLILFMVLLACWAMMFAQPEKNLAMLTLNPEIVLDKDIRNNYKM